MGGRAEYVTRAREAIADVLRRDRRFMPAAEIRARLEGVGRKVSLSTVYRTLDHLHAKGEIATRTDEQGEAAYIYCESQPSHHHHHAICQMCGHVEDVDCTAVEQFAQSLRARSGFELNGHAMEFFGRCNACRTAS